MITIRALQYEGIFEIIIIILYTASNGWEI